jgi:hypothetical protein
MACIYCSSCGSKLEYTATKPNFCNGCGNKIASLANVGVTAPTSRSVASQEEVVEEEPRAFEFPDKLTYTIEGGRKSVSAKELLDNPLNPNDIAPPRVSNVESVTPGDYFKKSMSDCASVKVNGKSINTDG